MAQLLSIEHLATLAVIAAGSLGLALAARRRPGTWTGAAARTLAVALLANEVGWWIFDWSRGTWSLASSLPLQLCQAVTFVAAAALWTRRPLLAEVTYFWAFAGTLQALLTPDLPDHFPAYPFVQYYLGHGLVIAGALFLVVGLRLEPRRGAVGRVFALTAAYAGLVGLADALTGADYMFLRRPPGSHSLLDLLGPWPWYIL
ncbi:MAG TPA: TIGR02206 family membrane protein, partial [Candidatus Acidoferrales bacterium]|nr:TIGR02206 family membrane protein [Candidatus Acidoferrales bacterium]